MGNLNFTAAKINELLAKMNSLPEVGDIATRTFTGATYQPKGDYALVTTLADYATLTAMQSLIGQVEALSTALNTLKTRFETMLGEGDVSAVIDSFTEMEAFLAGVTNMQTLTGILADLRTELIGMIPTGTAKQTDLTALTARVTALETASASQATAVATQGTAITGLQTDVSGLQTEMAKRPALPETMVQGATYAIEDGEYAKIFDATDVLLKE